MNIRVIKREFVSGKHQFNEMSELLEFDTGNTKGRARISIRLDNSYQGHATVWVWRDGWQEVYSLLAPVGKYGYQESRMSVFQDDRDELIKLLGEVLA